MTRQACVLPDDSLPHRRERPEGCALRTIAAHGCASAVRRGRGTRTDRIIAEKLWKPL